MSEINQHPWGDFLNARYKCILWMTEEMGYDDKQIANFLSMDEIQISLIKKTMISLK
jgi:hypothetical protein